MLKHLSMLIRIKRRFRLRLSSLMKAPSVNEELAVQRRSAVNHNLIALRKDSQACNIQGIVFSMDRAFQLDALLGSYQDKVRNPAHLTLIYRASNAEHERAYDNVFHRYSGIVSPVRQNSRSEFKSLLVKTLSESSADPIFFLVDDDIFIESIDLYELASFTSPFCIPSLRLGRNLTRSYVVQADQPLPTMISITDSTSNGIHAWIWNLGCLEWAYPLSLDGHFFMRHELLALIQALDFDSPNHLEQQMQIMNSLFNTRLGVCYSKSKILNIPFNRVQNDFNNLHGSVHQSDLLAMWIEGYQLDRSSYYGICNESAHQDLQLKLIRRNPPGPA
jgi:hypothetical protein